MPTKPADRWKYAEETGWPQARAVVAARAAGRCEFCGVAKGAPTKSGGPIVLTVAHLDHDPPTHNPERLRHLCQACHLAYDAAHDRRDRRSIP